MAHSNEERIGKLGKRIDELVTAAQQNGENIRALARIAEKAASEKTDLFYPLHTIVVPHMAASVAAPVERPRLFVPVLKYDFRRVALGTHKFEIALNFDSFFAG
jgi:hypothetical protein